MKLFIQSLKQTGQKAPVEWSRMELFYEVALEFILKFKPHETKSFDMLCLWFFALEMVSEELAPVNLTNETIDLVSPKTRINVIYQYSCVPLVDFVEKSMAVVQRIRVNVFQEKSCQFFDVKSTQHYGTCSRRRSRQ
jgi:hypothetical protein